MNFGVGVFLIFFSLSFYVVVVAQPTATMTQVGTAYPAPGAGYQLVQTQIVFRHGDRTPEKLYPGEEKQWTEFCSLDGLASSPYHPGNPKKISLQAKKEEEGGEGNPFLLFRAFYEGTNQKTATCSLGVLTKVGMKQLFTLGQEFRSIYGQTTLSHVTSLSSPNLYLRSTDVPRTILSAKNFMAGMFQGILSSSTDPQGDGAEIHLYDPSVENMFPSDVLCPGVREVTLNLFLDPYINQGVEALKLKILSILLNQSNPFFDVKNEWIVKEKTFQRLFFVESFYDIICSYLYQKTFIVQLLGSDLVAQIAAQAQKERQFVFSKPQFTRLLSGYFLQQLSENFVLKINNNTYDAMLFSAHDITLMPLMGTITNGYAIPYPGYAAFTLLELLLLNGVYYVRVIYNNGYVASLPFQPPEASNQYFLVNWGQLCPGVRDQFYCPLSSFLANVNDVMSYVKTTCPVSHSRSRRSGEAEDREMIWPL